jgi:hypothetical protein
VPAGVVVTSNRIDLSVSRLRYRPQSNPRKRATALIWRGCLAAPLAHGATRPRLLVAPESCHGDEADVSEGIAHRTVSATPHLGYAWVIAFRELLRAPQIPVEIRRGGVILAGFVTGPFVISAFAWWVMTGKHPPGPLGIWLRDPAVVRVNMSESCQRLCSRIPPHLMASRNSGLTGSACGRRCALNHSRGSARRARIAQATA